MGPNKPGMVTAIAILTLIDGIMNLLVGLGYILSLFLAPIGIYAIVLGIMELIYAPQLLANPIQAPRLKTHIAVMQIINIISCQGLSLVTGILALVFAGNPEVRAYFHGGSPQWQPLTPLPQPAEAAPPPPAPQ